VVSLGSVEVTDAPPVVLDSLAARPSLYWSAVAVLESVNVPDTFVAPT
jgi:hypothetical protein